MATETRDRRFNMVMSEREHAMLTELAEARGAVSVSDVVRALIRQAHRAEFGAVPVVSKIVKAAKGRK